jgi:hypothetical protein
MTLYAPAVDALEGHLSQDSSLPPQIFLPLGRMIPAVVLSSLYLSIMPRLERLSLEDICGTKLWREVVNLWASTGPWERVEKRLGPRLRDGGFPPPAEGRGVLEGAIREWRWWPPSGRISSDVNPSHSMDDETSDLVHGLLAWAKPFRWAGGWDVLWSQLDLGSCVQPILERTVPHLLFEGGRVPGAPATEIHMPRWLSKHVKASSLTTVRRRWERLLTDA